MKTLIWNSPVFTASLFIIAEIWVQPKCPSVDEWINKMWLVCVWNLAICEKVDGPGGHYCKWPKSEKDKYCVISFTCGVLKTTDET